MSKYAEKNMQYAHFAKICEKCGKVPNMRQSHIRVFLTCLTGPAPGPLRTHIASVWSRNIFSTGLSPLVAFALLF